MYISYLGIDIMNSEWLRKVIVKDVDRVSYQIGLARTRCWTIQVSGGCLNTELDTL